MQNNKILPPYKCVRYHLNLQQLQSNPRKVLHVPPNCSCGAFRG